MSGLRKRVLREVLVSVRFEPRMLAHVEISGEDDKSEILPAAQLWKRQDLLDRFVIWHRVDKDENKNPRMIILLGQTKKAR